MGTYVCAENGDGNLVVVNRPEAKEWESFELSRLNEIYVTLKANNGKYLCAESGGGSIIVANRNEAIEWEKFKLFINPLNGLVSLQSYNGQYVSAESSGILMANRSEVKEWESFRLVAPSLADNPQTQIEINVYKIVSAPLWHTGTVIDGEEYYFQTNNRVETCSPRGMDLVYHRKMIRLVPGDLEKVKSILAEVINRWNNTRYDVASHNCNFFTDDLIKSLGTTGLDQEYINASGLVTGLRSLPGGALFQELLIKWPIEDKRLDTAFMDDLKRLLKVPVNVVDEIKRVFNRIYPGSIDWKWPQW